MVKAKGIKEASGVIDQAFVDLGVLLTKTVGTLVSAQTVKKMKEENSERKFLNKITKAMR